MKPVVTVIKPSKLGRIGDGKNVVLDRQSAGRIHAGETDAAAI